MIFYAHGSLRMFPAFNTLTMRKDATGTAFDAAVGHQADFAVFDRPATGWATHRALLRRAALVANRLVLDRDVRPVGVNAIAVLEQFFFNLDHHLLQLPGSACRAPQAEGIAKQAEQ